MTHHTSMLRVGGQWRNLLVIESDQEETFTTNDVQVALDSSEGPVTITYYTDGLYKSLTENLKHYYWFLYNAAKVSVNGDNEEVLSLKNELNEYTTAMQEAIEE